MNVREMHIEVQQSTQLLAAGATRKLLSEEIDWALNKVQDRFIEDQIRPREGGRFEVDQARVDNIRSLIKSMVPLTPWVDNDRRYKCYLPKDYRFLLSDASYTLPLCGAPVTEEAQVTKYLHRIKQLFSAKVAPNYYTSYWLSLDQGFDFYLPASLPLTNNYLGYARKEDISFIGPIVAQLNKRIYWERFGDFIYPNHFLELRDTVPTLGLVTMDGAAAPNSILYDTLTLKKHAGVGNFHDNRLTPSSSIASLQTAAFFATKHYSPISELNNNILYVYRDNSFIVSGIEISYISAPQTISLSLGTDCNLPETTHQKICDLTTEYILSTLIGQKTKDIAERVTL